jgi:hypothetical protein
MSNTTMITFGVPTELLESLGRLVVAHSHLDYILRMTIKSLTGVELAVALEDTRRVQASKLRKQILELAAARLSEDDVKQLEALIKRLNAVSYYSRELGAYYFTYRDDDRRSRFVLFDDDRSMIKKMATARQSGYREAFLLYSDARDSLPQLKEIAT